MQNLITRRRVLYTAATALAAGSVLSRCTQVQNAAWQALLQSVGQDFVTVEPELQGQGFNANTPITVGGVTTTLSGVASLVQQLTNGISAASTATQGASVLTTVETYVNAVVPVIWPVLAPFVTAASPGGGFAIGLIVANLPLIEAAINLEVDFGKTLLTAQAQSLAVLAPKTLASGKLRRFAL
jgi:hypothetical protein